MATQASPVGFYVCSGDKSLGIVSWNTDNAALSKSYSSIGSMSYRMSDIAILPDGRLFGISQPGVVLQKDSIASIKTKGLIGEKFIEITPGNADQVIAPNGVIHDTEPAMDFESIISKYVQGNVSKPAQ